MPRSSATETDANSDAESAESKGSGLSKAAKIGISVAAAVVGLLLLGALLGFLLLRRRRTASNSARQEYSMSEFTPSQKDLIGNAAVPDSDRY